MEISRLERDDQAQRISMSNNHNLFRYWLASNRLLIILLFITNRYFHRAHTSTLEELCIFLFATFPLHYMSMGCVCVCVSGLCSMHCRTSFYYINPSERRRCRYI